MKWKLPDRDITSSPLAEHVPVLRFLGFGIWEAWILLCFDSTEVARLFPVEQQTSLVFTMYLFSTVGMICTLFAVAAAWRRFSKYIASRRYVVFAGVAGCFSTILMGMSGYLASSLLFSAISFVTGIATAALCLRMGYVYGTISLPETLVAGFLSLFLAVLLYFVGIGIPEAWRLFYIGALPLGAALLLSMRSIEEYPSAEFEGQWEWEYAAPPRPFPFAMFARIAAASAIVALTAGVAKGISSYQNDPALYASQESIVVFFIGLVALVIVFCVNRLNQSSSLKAFYTCLMLMGIAFMLATCFGCDISYLGVGKEVLWVMFSCLMAYLAFRYNVSAIRVFALGQGCYFLFSLLGWIGGYLLAPLYGNFMVRMGLGIGMAFLIVVVMSFVFTDGDLERLLHATHNEEMGGADVGVAGAAGAAGSTTAGGTGAAGSTAAGGTGAAGAGAAGAAGSTATGGAGAGTTDTGAAGAGTTDTEQSGASVGAHFQCARDAGSGSVPNTDASGAASDAAEGAGTGRAGTGEESTDGGNVTGAGVANFGNASVFASSAGTVTGGGDAYSAGIDPTGALNIAKAMAEPYCLSEREAQIMELYAQGRSANWIADDLVISKNTVRSHLRAVYSKLDIHSRQDLLDFLEA